MMTGFNMLNPSAAARVLAPAAAKGVATLVMFAARRALSDPEALKQTLAKLGVAGLDPDDPLGFLVAEGGAENLVDAAYRYCRHAAPNSVILTGTGNPAHLEANVASLLSPPLAPAALARLAALFGGVDSISGD